MIKIKIAISPIRCDICKSAKATQYDSKTCRLLCLRCSPRHGNGKLATERLTSKAFASYMREAAKRAREEFRLAQQQAECRV